MRERIFNIINLSTANSEQAKEIVKVHNIIFGAEFKICVNCPEQLRAAVKRLKLYYKDNYCE